MNKAVSILIILIILVGVLYAVIFFNRAGNTGNGEDFDISNTNDMNTTRATIKTNKGDIVLELYTEQMPLTTGNFLKLAQDGFYDGVKFHRVIPKFMVQGGDPLTKDDSDVGQWGTGGPGYTILDEFVEGLSNVRGTIAMANTGRPNSGGSQWFINIVDNTGLDFDKEPSMSKHPVFGYVVEGMGVVDEIVSVPTEGEGRPIESVVIESVIIE